MLEGESVELTMRRYSISPGDGSMYRFSIVPLNGAPHIRQVIGGIGDGEGYVGLILHDSRQGCHEVLISSVKDPIPPFIFYLREKMSLDASYHYRILAMVLAAGVLIDQPDALEEAAEAMLQARSMTRFFSQELSSTSSASVPTTSIRSTPSRPNPE